MIPFKSMLDEVGLNRQHIFDNSHGPRRTCLRRWTLASTNVSSSSSDTLGASCGSACRSRQPTRCIRSTPTR